MYIIFSFLGDSDYANQTKYFVTGTLPVLFCLREFRSLLHGIWQLQPLKKKIIFFIFLLLHSFSPKLPKLPYRTIQFRLVRSELQSSTPHSSMFCGAHKQIACITVISISAVLSAGCFDFFLSTNIFTNFHKYDYVYDFCDIPVSKWAKWRWAQ
jgi:hypothetical protein